MPRSSTLERAIQVRREQTTDGARYVDLGLVVKDGDGITHGTGEVLLDVGGKWDRREKKYVGEAELVRPIEVHPGQTEACRFFAEWLDRYKRGEHLPDDERIYSVILSGGQRSGKSWLGVCTFAAAFALANPGSYVWIVCPTGDDFEEVEDMLEATLPASWYTHQKTRNRFAFHNGARIVLRSAHRPESLKKGRCDLPIMNEAQQMQEKAFAICRARIADSGGMVVGCANPPDKPIGEWVGDWVAEADSGTRQAKHFWFNPFDNPHIDHAPLLALKHELDPRTYDAEVLGKFLSIGDAVFYNWDRLVNETTIEKLTATLRKHPDVSDDYELRDITREVTRVYEGRAYERVLGVDVQRRPMASVEYRFFENPLAPLPNKREPRAGDWSRWCLSVIVNEVILEGDEADLALAWDEAGWDPDATLIICDASAKWQFGERDPIKVQKLREQVKGRGSWAVFRSLGWSHLRNPDRDMEANPDIIERVRAATARVATKVAGPFGRHFLFVLSHCKQTSKAVRSWPTLHGKPSRSSSHAHVGDSVTYVMHRIFTRRRLGNETPVDQRVKIIPRFKRRRQMKNW